MVLDREVAGSIFYKALALKGNLGKGGWFMEPIEDGFVFRNSNVKPSLIRLSC